MVNSGQTNKTQPTILVIGGLGYIGSHMVEELLGQGHRVVILDDLSTGFRESYCGGKLITGCLGDPGVLDSVFGYNRIDAVMHFAAFSLVGESVTDPLKYYKNNIAKTIELLSAMKKFGVNRFIFSSTAAVYGEPLATPITEEHPCLPTNPYGTTKLTIEQLLRDCAAAFDFRYIALRYFNAAGAHPSGQIGERHNPESHLIPLVLKVATGEREAISIYGTDYPTPDGTCVRDYIHVNDLTRAHLLALTRLLAGGDSGCFNLGNSKGYSVREVIEIARKVTGHSIPVIAAARRSGDPSILVAGSDKIRRVLGWKPQFEDLETIIQTAWRWHHRTAPEKKRTDSHAPGQPVPNRNTAPDTMLEQPACSHEIYARRVKTGEQT
ncbi:MAG: UDP-glucose 4-epimerase GalE [Proteobacteria bacterium]|nr:UDP-glucose 4-epimerase GalE [Pseudomonadota bacterium]MBU1736837.1 UDP-glucose 4-epimerase GalE [Pseudomonadota bacterium]